MSDDKYLKEEFVNVEPVGNDLRPSDKLSVGDACKELKNRTKPPEYHWERWKTKGGHCDCLDCREYRAELYLKTHERNEELTCPHQDEQHRWCEIHALPYHRELEECADCRAGKPPIEKAQKKQEDPYQNGMQSLSGLIVPTPLGWMPWRGAIHVSEARHWSGGLVSQPQCDKCFNVECKCKKEKK